MMFSRGMQQIQFLCRLNCNLWYQKISSQHITTACNGYICFSNRNVQYKGIKGLKSRKIYNNNLIDENVDNNAIDANNLETLEALENKEYELLANDAMHVTKCSNTAHNVFIIQPYIKWGVKRNTSTTPEEQLQEAEALINSLPNWNVALALKVPVESLDRKTLFGTGKLEELKSMVHQLNRNNQKALTCMFISKSSLSYSQKTILESIFKLPVMDRYSIVIQILRLHATSAEARLQVAMAEIPYIWSQAKEANVTKSTKAGFHLSDNQKEILKSRERKLKQQLMQIRTQRKLLRNKRKQRNFPIVAVVGYTNAGKTSLIKALTQEKTMQPRDQLFATLDVTAHAGLLPSKLKVIYMDTVGFMSDLPTGLIECFVATLEDAMLADIIVHVQDISHSCYTAQKQHVEYTLKTLTNRMSTIMGANELELPPIINVANKIDLVPDQQMEQLKLTADDDNNLLKVSSKTLIGLDHLLHNLEMKILNVTNRRRLTIRVRSGGAEMAWLHKNAAVVNMRVDEESLQHTLMDVIIKDGVMQQFKGMFCK